MYSSGDKVNYQFIIEKCALIFMLSGQSLEGIPVPFCFNPVAFSHICHLNVFITPSIVDRRLYKRRSEICQVNALSLIHLTILLLMSTLGHGQVLIKNYIAWVLTWVYNLKFTIQKFAPCGRQISSFTKTEPIELPIR